MNAFYKIAGIAALATGLVIQIYAYLKSGAAQYSDTLNMGLLNDKTNLMLLGSTFAIVGAIFMAVSALMPSTPSESRHQD